MEPRMPVLRIADARSVLQEAEIGFAAADRSWRPQARRPPFAAQARVPLDRDNVSLGCLAPPGPLGTFPF